MDAIYIGFATFFSLQLCNEIEAGRLVYSISKIWYICPFCR